MRREGNRNYIAGARSVSSGSTRKIYGPIIISSNTAFSFTPKFIFDSNQVLGVWSLRTSDVGKIEGKNISFGNSLGSANFFKAPLIERDYIVGAKILD